MGSFRDHTDLAKAVVVTAPSPASSGTTLDVSNTDDANMPAVPFYATAKPVGAEPIRSNSEIIYVTAKSVGASNTTYTIQRTKGRPATSARSIIVGDEIIAGVYGQDLKDYENSIPAAPNLMRNGNFINNSTNGYGNVPDDWSQSNGNIVQGGFPSLSKQDLIDILGVADSDIKGLWNLNGNFNDLSSNGYNLTSSGSPTDDSDGLMAQTKKFASASNQYASNSAANCRITGNQTWFCFVKPTTVTGIQRYIGRGNGSAAFNFVNLLLDASTAPNPQFQCQNLTTNTIVTSDVKLEAGKWYLLIGIYDSSNSKLKIWVNGIKKEVTASGSSTSAGTETTAVGRCGSYAADYANAAIQCAGVLGVALTDNQALSLFAETLYKGVKLRRSGSDSYLIQFPDRTLVQRLRGKTIMVSAKMWQEVANTGAVNIYDTANNLSDAVAPTGQWVDVYKSVTLNNATRDLEIDLKVITSNGNVWFKEVSFYLGNNILPYDHSKEDWYRFPRLLRLDPPNNYNGYSYEEKRWYTSFVPVFTGFTGSVTTNFQWMVDGKNVYIQDIINGTSNATGKTFTLPVYPTAAGQMLPRLTIQDNGTWSDTLGYIELNTGSFIATVRKSFSNNNFTASGSTRWTFQLQYQTI